MKGDHEFENEPDLFQAIPKKELKQVIKWVRSASAGTSDIQSVDLIGSCAMGLTTQRSNIDVCVQASARGQMASFAIKCVAEFMRDSFGCAIQHDASFNRIPHVQLTTPNGRVVDITMVHDDTAVTRARLFHAYFKSEPRALHLMRLVRRWAADNQLSGARDGLHAITPDALCVMVISYLQQLSDPVLPNLPVRAEPSHKKAHKHLGHSRSSSPGPLFVSTNPSSVAALEKDFFSFFRDFPFSVRSIALTPTHPPLPPATDKTPPATVVDPVTGANVAATNRIVWRGICDVLTATADACPTPERTPGGSDPSDTALVSPSSARDQARYRDAMATFEQSLGTDPAAPHPKRYVHKQREEAAPASRSGVGRWAGAAAGMLAAGAVFAVSAGFSGSPVRTKR